jgi:hypothetical protein
MKIVNLFSVIDEAIMVNVIVLRTLEVNIPIDMDSIPIIC